MLGALDLQGASNLWVCRWGVQIKVMHRCWPVFAESLAEKRVLMKNQHLCSESVSETISNQGLAQFSPNIFEKDGFCRKRSCDTRATPCDILRRFLRRLRRFLRSMTSIQRKGMKVWKVFTCWMSCPRLAALNLFKSLQNPDAFSEESTPDLYVDPT